MPKGDNYYKINQIKRDNIDWSEEQKLVSQANAGVLLLLNRTGPSMHIRVCAHKCTICNTTFDAARRDSKRGMVRCPLCKINKPERELVHMIEGFGFDVETHNRTQLNGYEIDIFIPEANVGIEYHGLYWHRNDKKTHAIKYAMSVEKNIRLIQIFSDEWDNRRQAIEAIIKNALGIRQERIGARKLSISVVDDSSDFYDTNHIQGKPRKGGVTYGLWNGDVLYAAMSFNRPYSRRKATGPNQWELTRYATALNVQGGASRLFKHFLKHNDVVGIVSYSDQRFFTGGIYTMLGFARGKTTVDYEYSDKTRRYHKSNFKKGILRKIYGEAYDDTKTEFQMTDEMGLVRLYNAGRVTWHYGKTETLPETGEVVSVGQLVEKSKLSKLNARARQSTASLALWKTKEHRKKMKAFKTTLKDNNEFKTKVSIASKKHWKNPTYRTKVMTARAAPAALEKRRATARARTGAIKTWVHQEHGTKVAYHGDLMDEFGGDSAAWLRVHKGKKKTCYGWSLAL